MAARSGDGTPARKDDKKDSKKGDKKGDRHESLHAVHPTTGRYISVNGGHYAGGAVAYYQLPVSALPQVDYPTIQVVTFYPERART